MSKTTGNDDDDRNNQPIRPSNTYRLPGNPPPRISFGGRWYVLIAVGVVVIVLVILGSRAAVTVETGNIGIVTEWGAATNKLLQPGLAFINPVSEGVVQFDVRTQREDAPANVFSKDLQGVNATLALNYRLDPLHVQDVFKNIGRDYSHIVIDAKVQEAFKATTAKYTAEELIAKRDLVKQDAEKLLADRLSPYNIIVQDLNIVDFQWTSQDFINAIEQKQVAAQNVLKAEQDKAKQDVVNEQNISIAETAKQQAILDAQGKAEANRLLQASISPQVLLLETIRKWNGVYPLYLGGGGSGTILQLPAITADQNPQPSATPGATP
jgi:regulator of protease activity HflC (stomatin/prohibitin superfamily)